MIKVIHHIFKKKVLNEKVNNIKQRSQIIIDIPQNAMFGKMKLLQVLAVPNLLFYYFSEIYKTFKCT